MPDIIIKTALEPDFGGRYELYGLARFFKDEKVVTSSSGNPSSVGGGIGASAYIHAVPGLLDLSGNILAGYGIGRYGPAGLPDATYKANGAPQPLTEIEATIGAVGHVLKFEDGTPRLDLFAYGGIEAKERTSAAPAPTPSATAIQISSTPGPTSSRPRLCSLSARPIPGPQRGFRSASGIRGCTAVTGRCRPPWSINTTSAHPSAAWAARRTRTSTCSK